MRSSGFSADEWWILKWITTFRSKIFHNFFLYRISPKIYKWLFGHLMLAMRLVKTLIHCSSLKGKDDPAGFEVVASAVEKLQFHETPKWAIELQKSTRLQP